MKTVCFVIVMELFLKSHNTIFSIIAEVSVEMGIDAYLVGGYVRDVLLERESEDIDVVVLGSGIEFAQKFATKLKGSPMVTLFKNFGTAMVHYENLEIEFVGARKESYRKNSRKPIVENGSLDDDLARRDFTINSMALKLSDGQYGQLVDPFNGLSDLHNKILKTPLEPGITFSDDPLRMMRAIRFSASLGFEIEKITLTAIRENSERISIVSQERISVELNKIMASQHPSIGFLLLDKTGLLPLIMPWVCDLKGVDVIKGNMHKDNFHHTLKVVDNVAEKSDNLWLRWAALLHDIGKPKTKRYQEGIGWTFHGHDFLGSKMVPEIFRQLKLPLNDRMKYVQKLVALHLRPISLVSEEITDSAIRRLIYEAGDEIEDLMLLCEADITSKNQKVVKTHLNNFTIVRKKLKEIEGSDAIRNFQPPVDGTEIMKIFNLTPGREIGILKKAVKEAILEGDIKNNHEEAISFLIKKAAEIGIYPEGYQNRSTTIGK